MPIPKPKKGEQEKDFIERCMGAIGGEYDDSKQAVAICYSTWRDRNKKPKGNEMHPLVANLDLTDVRDATWKGRQYKVAPVVMAKEGVMNQLLYPADELGKYVGAWNGRPLTLFHPMADGDYISANDSTVPEEIHMGLVRNARYEEGLRGEAWLDVYHTQKARPEVLEYFSGARQGLEVSTGLWGDVLPVPGEWKGEPYAGIMTNIRPDHLALLPGGEGACNWQQGCGLRANTTTDAEVIISTESGQQYRQSYTIDENGQVALIGNAEAIVAAAHCGCPEQKGGKNQMEREEKIKALIADPRTRFEAGCEVFLNTLEDEQLDRLLPPDNVILRPEEPPEPPAVNEPKPAEPAVVQEPPKSATEWLAAQETMPKEIKDTMTDALMLNAARKAELIESIVKDPRNTFTNDQLTGKSRQELESIAGLIRPIEGMQADPAPAQFYGMRLVPNTKPEDDKGPEPMVMPSLQEAFAKNLRK